MHSGVFLLPEHTLVNCPRVIMMGVLDVLMLINMVH